MTRADRERLLAIRVRHVLNLPEDAPPGDVIHEIIRLQRVERELRRFQAKTRTVETVVERSETREVRW